MTAWIWVLIPLSAILLGFFTEWLKFKSKQEKLGTSAHELEETVERLEAALEGSEKEREALMRRLQNLETIVTSEDWDVLHGAEHVQHVEHARSAEHVGHVERPSAGEPLLRIPTDDHETEAERKAEQLARRLTR